MNEIPVIGKRCIRAREHVSLELDGELSDFERALLTAHLANCSGCRRFEADVVALTKQLRAAPAETLSRPVSLPSPRRFVPARLIPAAAAAAAVVAVGLGAAVSLVDTTTPASAPFARAGAPDENTHIRRVRVAAMRPAPPAPQGVQLRPIVTTS